MFYAEAGVGIIAYRSLLTLLDSDYLISARGYNDYPMMNVDTITTKAR